MTERVKCSNNECEAMILIATAERNGGVCMPCRQSAERLARVEYVRKNRRDVDLFFGVTDPVEILKIMHLQAERDPLINLIPYQKTAEEVYGSMNSGDIARLKAYLVELLDDEEYEQALDIVKELASFTDANLADICAILAEAEEYYPGYIFRTAGSELADNLIARLNRAGEGEIEQLQLSHMLDALAWIGTDNVVRQFVGWRKEPPQWEASLYIKAHEYAHSAGWELDGEDRRHELTLPSCYRLVSGKNSADATISTCTPAGFDCHWCGKPVTNLFTVDLSGSGLAGITLPQKQLTIATCEVCGFFAEQFYMRVDINGRSSWYEGNVKPETVPDPNDYGSLPQNKLKLLPQPLLHHHSTDWCLPTGFTQIGGHPSWSQDTGYVPCPECGRQMQFVAQLSVEDLEEYGEGIYYGLLCPECMITRVTYQQT